MNNARNIGEIFAQRLFKIPDYQRGYAWEKQQLDEFTEDLELLAEQKEHYMGTLVLDNMKVDPREDEEGNKYSAFNIVDGQQRLTTIVLLLDAISREMREIGTSRGEKLSEGIQKNYVSVVDGNNGQPIYKLELNEDDNHFFVDRLLVGHHIGGAKNFAQERLVAAKEYFDNYLEGKRERLDSSYETWLRQLHNKVTTQLRVIVYEVENKFDVGIIFEVMNNRGKPISELDKVKNYLLFLASKLDVPADNLFEKINYVWRRIFECLMRAKLAGAGEEDWLLRAHWIMAYDYDRRNWKGSKSIKKQFSLRDYEGQHKKLLSDLDTYVDTLDRASEAYRDIEKPGHNDAFSNLSSDSSLYQQVIDVGEKLQRTKRSRTFTPLLMAARLRYPSDGQKYLDVVKLCEIFAFRVFLLLEKRVDAGEAKLARVGHELYSTKLSLEEALDEVRQELLRHCSEEEFRNSFEPDEEQNNWYRWQPGLKYFLYEYEDHLRRTENKNVGEIPWGKVRGKPGNTIEHILPQHPEDSYWFSKFDEEERRLWTHDIANLCLTYDNSALSNKPFDEKKGSIERKNRCYANSLLLMERQLARLEDWNTENLKSRRKELVDWALHRWHIEETEPASPEPEEDEEL